MIEVPKRLPFYVSEEHQTLLEAIDALSSKGERINVLVKGDRGCGKSELARQYAASRQRPFAVLEIGQLNDPNQIFGYMEFVEGVGTRFVKGLFVEAVTTPNCVLHLQEINRAESDKALNALMTLLDDSSRSIWINEMQDFITVAEGVTIFASMNEGMEYIGTMPIDPAVENRFHIKISLTNLPKKIESTLLVSKFPDMDPLAANTLVDEIGSLRANTQRPIAISTRDVVNIATLLEVGVSKFTALKAVLGSDNDKVESVLLGMYLDGGNTGKKESSEYDLLVSPQEKAVFVLQQIEAKKRIEEEQELHDMPKQVGPSLTPLDNDMILRTLEDQGVDPSFASPEQWQRAREAYYAHQAILQSIHSNPIMSTTRVDIPGDPYDTKSYSNDSYYPALAKTIQKVCFEGELCKKAHSRAPHIVKLEVPNDPS